MADNYTAGATLASRTVSAFPISIGTSLAFESVFFPRQPSYDPERQIPNRVEVTQYQS